MRAKKDVRGPSSLAGLRRHGMVMRPTRAGVVAWGLTLPPNEQPQPPLLGPRPRRRLFFGSAEVTIAGPGISASFRPFRFGGGL